MNLEMDKNLAENYKSPAQRVRVMTEAWVAKQAYCPNCGRNQIKKYPNNHPAGDFLCPKCGENFELKSKSGLFGGRVVDGAYQAMVKAMSGSTNPNFFFLSYIPQYWRVNSLFIVPQHYFVPDIIIKRPPLSPTARRAGWVGCDISLGEIPDSGRIGVVEERAVRPKPAVLADWKKTLFLRQKAADQAKGWLLDVMRCVENLGKKEFSLGEVYGFEDELLEKHPQNKNIKPKIRQQLQVLRDQGYLKFISPGQYRMA